MPLAKGCSQLAPQLNVKGFPPDPTSSRLWALPSTAVALYNYRAAQLSMDLANTLRHSGITLNPLVTGVHPETGLEFVVV